MLVLGEFVVTASVLIFCSLFRWPQYMLSLVVRSYFGSGYHCIVVAIHVDLSRLQCLDKALFIITQSSCLQCVVEWHVALLQSRFL